ncbi:class I SAM-dependent methyltransferase [Pseudonocardia humida]|uniref:Class I SAM-dependent methyltransferase n=1 Tax=Pseudonocardia humida TaxID=2800819 RepID=A0ABT1A9D5_9PSEU|nr:class I SAM-dependent methyltransferase [Pseudonocardia humida]MCO1659556.1 class I SAM-dependent methyltransferase [Pseudonocardia humida]
MLDDDALTGTSKTDFTDIYTQPDPRAYFSALVGLEYQIPQRALPVVEAVLAGAQTTGGPRTVLDLCCSYGINAALLRHRLDLTDIAARATDPDLAALPPAELIEADRRFYADHLRRPELTALGLDVSAPAIDYARATGLLADGWAEDLEAADPSPELAAGVAGTGLVVCTGGVGYIGHRTFERLLGALDDPGDLWLVVFVLRVFDYADVATALAEFGLVTEQVEGETFVQRRCADDGEFDAANTDVARRGLDPTGREADGWYHADCYVTRPAAAAAATPLSELLAGVGAGTG